MGWSLRSKVGQTIIGGGGERREDIGNAEIVGEALLYRGVSK